MKSLNDKERFSLLNEVVLKKLRGKLFRARYLALSELAIDVQSLLAHCQNGLVVQDTVKRKIKNLV